MVSYCQPPSVPQTFSSQRDMTRGQQRDVGQPRYCWSSDICFCCGGHCSLLSSLDSIPLLSIPHSRYVFPIVFAMAPTPVATQFPAPSAAHSTGYSANALITFYASISLLGCSVIFLVGYYAVKACKGSTTPTGKAGSMQPADSRKTRRHVIRHLVSSPHAPKVISQLAARLCPGQDGKASVGSCCSPLSTVS